MMPLKRLLMVIGVLVVAVPSRAQTMGQIMGQTMGRTSNTRINGTQTTRPLIPVPGPPDTTAENHSAPTAQQAIRDFRNDELFRSSNSNGLELSLLHQTKTPFMTQSRVPVAQLPGSRLQVNFFVTSLNNSNLMLGPQAAHETIHPLGQPRSADMYGVGVSIPLGRGPGSGGSQGLLHGLSRILHGR
jgi:hypothetical protein